MFGGQGSKAMLSIARQLDNTQLILVCGHNATLAEQLRALPSRTTHLVLGYTPDIAATMQLADFLIGKPGPGSLSEAVRSGLPVIVARNAWTMPQERYNTQWVRENGLGLVLSSFRRIDTAVTELLDRLDDFKSATRRLDNQALFEVPEILAGILEGSEALLPTPLAA
jgi:UDP-N-acetylglucosamine:LPS N-acetylglucosamine transferase